MTGLQRFIRPQRFCPIRPGAGYKNHILDRCRIIAGQRLLCTEAEAADGAEKQGERRPKPPKYTKVELPQLMETMKTGTIEEWKIAEGSAIEVNMDLCLIDTEMAQFYLHAPCDGVLAKIIAKEGEEVEVGGTVAILVDSSDHIAAAIEEYALEHPGSVSQSKASGLDARADDDAKTAPPSQHDEGGGQVSAAAQVEKDYFDKLDGNKDGVIDEEEWQNFVQTHADAIKKWTPDDVEKWLLGLQFDPDTVVSKLKHYKGKDLLRLKKEDAEHYFGLEGIRLVNEIEDLLSSLSAASKEDASSPSS